MCYGVYNAFKQGTFRIRINRYARICQLDKGMVHSLLYKFQHIANAVCDISFETIDGDDSFAAFIKT